MGVVLVAGMALPAWGGGEAACWPVLGTLGLSPVALGTLGGWPPGLGCALPFTLLHSMGLAPPLAAAAGGGLGLASGGAAPLAKGGRGGS